MPVIEGLPLKPINADAYEQQLAYAALDTQKIISHHKISTDGDKAEPVLDIIQANDQQGALK